MPRANYADESAWALGVILLIPSRLQQFFYSHIRNDVVVSVEEILRLRTRALLRRGFCGDRRFSARAFSSGRPLAERGRGNTAETAQSPVP